MGKLLPATLCLLASTAWCPAQETCSQQAQSATVAAAIAGRKQLLAIKLPSDLDSDVPASAQDLIPKAKSALELATQAMLACHDDKSDPRALESELAASLGATTSPPDPKKNVEFYGSNLRVSVAQPQPGLLTVQFQFDIDCGYDAVWMLFQLQGSHWKNTITWQSPPYKEDTGAFGDFFLTTILPGDTTHALRVVAAHGKPWCTSRFSGFGLDVLAPSNDPDHPHIVWHTDRGYSRADTAPSLRPTSDGFELRLNAPSDDIESFERKVIYRYRVNGDQATRIEPIAADARGFVEEWLASPWNEAAAQTAPEALAGMKPIHDRITNADKNASSYVSLTYGPVRSCLMKGQYEVEMIADPGGPQFYAVRQVANGYTLVNFGTTQDERCSGPDLMKKP